MGVGLDLSQMFWQKTNVVSICIYFSFLSILLVSGNQYDQVPHDMNQDHTVYLPEFRATNQNITVGPGDRAVLKCRVENLGTKTVTWRKRTESHPLTIGLFTFVGDTRISVDYNQRTNEWSLIIQDVKPTDEGVYECQISTKQNNMNSYEVKLNVKTVQVSGTDYVELGSQIQLMCNATGKPQPPHDVEWFKDGQKIISSAATGILITKKIETKVLISVLVIQKSKIRDNGFYICRSSNRDTGDIKVHVLNVTTNNGINRREGAKGELRAARGVAPSSSRPPTLLLLLLTTASYLLQHRHHIHSAGSCRDV